MTACNMGINLMMGCLAAKSSSPLFSPPQCSTQPSIQQPGPIFAYFELLLSESNTNTFSYTSKLRSITKVHAQLDKSLCPHQ